MKEDLPLLELMEMADELVAKGATVFFKFTCERCLERQTFDEPNTLYTSGHCEECGHVTKITEGGLLVMM